jgi:hypothetical protein
MGLNKHKWMMTAGAISAFAVAPGAAFGQTAQFVSCPAQIAHCVHEVSGWCEKEPNGKITIIYRSDRMGGDIYRQCVGKALEKAGRPNPYAPPKR